MIEVKVKLNSIEYYLLEGYRCGKGFLWKLFFGWRKTVYMDYNIVVYKIPAKDWKRINELAMRIK